MLRLSPAPLGGEADGRRHARAPISLPGQLPRPQLLFVMSCYVSVRASREMVNNNYELFVQYQNGEIKNAVFATGSSEMSAFRIGINYWPVMGSNNLKWTTDVAWSHDSLADGGAVTGNGSADWTGTGNGWRQDILNGDGQMLLRTQLQLLF